VAAIGVVLVALILNGRIFSRAADGLPAEGTGLGGQI
jgi:hypothetical protein